MKRKLAVLAAVISAAVAHGATITVTDPADFSSPTPYVINGDTVEYVGASAKVENALNVGQNGGVIKVGTADVTLEWAGDVTTAEYKTWAVDGVGCLKLTGNSVVGLPNFQKKGTGSVLFCGVPDYKMSVFYGYASTAIFDNSQGTVVQPVIGQDNGDMHLVLTNNATMINDSSHSDSENALGSGIGVWGSSEIRLECGSKMSHVAVGVSPKASLTVGKDATLAFSRPILSSSSALSFGGGGNVFVNGGTVTGFDNSNQKADTYRRWAQWFNGSTNVYVGPLGATFVAPSDLVTLWPRLVADEGATAPTVTKQGGGVLGLRSTALPVSVQTGTLRLGSAESNVNEAKLDGAVSFAANTSVQLAGHRSAAKMDLSGAPTVKFHPAGIETIRGQWVQNGWASVRADGYLQLSDSRTSWNGKTAAGSVFRKDKVAVDKSFSVAFGVVDWNIKGGTWHDQFGGFSLVFQNAPAGSAAVATESEGPSLCGYGTAMQENGFALLFYTDGDANRTMSVAKGATVTPMGAVADGRLTSFATFDKPIRIVFSYDAEKKKGLVTWTTVHSDKSVPTDTWEFDLDLPATVGADDAYFGFASAPYGGWKNCVFTVGQVSVTDGTEFPGVMRTGGEMTLAAGATRAFRTYGTEANPGYLMEGLAYGDRTTLDIAPLNVADAVGSFAGFEKYSGSGTLVKTGTGNLGIVGTNAQDVALEIAGGGLVLRSGEEVPADPLDWDWAYSDGRQGYDWQTIGAHGGIVVGDGVYSKCFCATTRQKFDITGNWRFSVDV